MKNNKINYLNKIILSLQKDKYYKENLYTKKINILKRILLSLKYFKTDISEALKKDLNKNEKESYIFEILPIENEIKFILKNLKKWSKKKKIKKNFSTFFTKQYFCFAPHGIVFIIVPFNFPFFLAFLPLINAIAAGNSIILLFSSKTPAIEKIFSKIINFVNLDNNYISIYFRKYFTNYESIYNSNVDFIFFTGGKKNGKNIAIKSIENNKLFALEMSGRSPLIIDNHNNFRKIIKKIVWAKLINAGQVCITLDYILLNKKNFDEFIKELKNEILFQYPESNMHNIPKIIDKKNYNRIINIIDSCETILKGKRFPEKLIIRPTIILVKDVEELKNIGEIFGPVFIIFLYDDFEKTFEIINKIDKFPLISYLFSENKNNKNKFISKICSKQISINELILQISNPNTSFGGYRSSGFLSYKGYQGYKLFSVKKQVLLNKLKYFLPFLFVNYKKGYKKIINLLKLIFKY